MSRPPSAPVAPDICLASIPKNSQIAFSDSTIMHVRRSVGEYEYVLARSRRQNVRHKVRIQWPSHATDQGANLNDAATSDHNDGRGLLGRA